MRRAKSGRAAGGADRLQGVRAADPDRPALDVVERLLSAGGSRARSRARPRPRARDRDRASTPSIQWGIDRGALRRSTRKARPGKTAADLEARDRRGRRRPRAASPCPRPSSRRRRTQLEADCLRGMKTVSGKANQLGFFEAVVGDYRRALPPRGRVERGDRRRRAARRGASTSCPRSGRWSCSSRSATAGARADDALAFVLASRARWRSAADESSASGGDAHDARRTGSASSSPSTTSCRSST